MFKISVLLDVQAKLPEASPFLACPNIVLGMYNFGLSVKLRQNSSIFSHFPKIPKFITFSLFWPFATFVSVLFNQHEIPQNSSNKQEEQAKSRFQNWKQFAIFHLPRATGFCKGGGQGCTLFINPEIRIENIVPYSCWNMDLSREILLFMNAPPFWTAFVEKTWNTFLKKI